MMPPDPPREGELGLGPVPMMTVIAKATYSFAGDREALSFAEETMALSLDLQGDIEGCEDEVAYPSDFVPVKPFCDILLHGHAFAEKPSKLLACGFEVASLSRAFAIESAAPVMLAPLSAKAVRRPDGLVADERVGPSATHERLVDHPAGFDFAAYCTAPEAQRIKAAPLGWKLKLTGLSPRAAKRVLALPATVPLAWIDTEEESAFPLDLICDTIWIDTDRELVVMVYRGMLEIASLEDDGVKRITIALRTADSEPELREVQRDLLRGAFEPAVELADFEDDEPSAHAAEEAALAQFALIEEDREPSISLETYAAVSAELAEGPDDRSAALAKHGLDDKSYLVEERAWLMKMGDSAMNGDTAIALRYGDLFLAAQDALAAPKEGKESVESFVALKVDMDEADDEQALLAERRMTLSEWMRMQRRWDARAKNDAAVRDDIERRTRAYRAARKAGR